MWRRWLEMEKRVSRHTLSAYTADLSGFLDFLTGYHGRPPSINDLSEARFMDFRAWLAREVARGRDGKPRARAVQRPQLLPVAGSKRAHAQPADRPDAGAQAAARGCTMPLPQATPAAFDGGEERRTSPGSPRATARCSRCCTAAASGSTKRWPGPVQHAGRDAPGHRQGSQEADGPRAPRGRGSARGYVAACPYSLTDEGALFAGHGASG